MTREQLQAAGADVPQQAYERLATFVEQLLSENRKLNLTGIRSPEEVWTLHVCESLALLPLIDEHQPAALLDLGAGGGVPGIPLACVRPDLQVTLIDATRKKIDATKRIVQAVGLTNVAAFWGRAETLAHRPDLREAFDAVAVRAVAKLPVLCEYAAGFARVGGRCWFMKTARTLESEITAAESAAKACRLRFKSALAYTLGAHGQRAIAVYSKQRPLPTKLPRPPGRASKSPL